MRWEGGGCKSWRRWKGGWWRAGSGVVAKSKVETCYVVKGVVVDSDASCHLLLVRSAEKYRLESQFHI